MNRKTKKSLLFAFTVLLLTVMTVFSVSAKTVTKNKLVYEVSKKTATLIECKSNAKEIKVPSKVGKYKVTAIGEWAFSGKKKLKSVELPKTVTKIGEAAFNECTSLKKIVIPSKVTRISSAAFWYCTNLETVVIPKSVTKLGKDVFEGCDKLTAYVVKGSKAEKYVKKLDNVTLGYRYMTSLELDADSVILEEDDTYKLTVTKKPKKLYNSKVSFSSSNKKVATVSSKGVIKAVGSGEAVITCKAKDGSGKKAVCTVTVNAKNNEKAVSPVPKAPSQVTGLKVTAVTDSSVSLSWNSVKDASGYRIYLYDSQTKTYTYRWASSVTSAEMKGLGAGKEYSFAVKAYTRNYYSSTDSTLYSSVVTGKTLPGRVSEIRAADELIYPDSMTLSWDAVDGAEGYNLYIYSKTEKDYVLFESTDGLSAEVTGLESGSDYRFRIKTFSGENRTEGFFSETFIFTTDYIPDTAPDAVEGFIGALVSTKKTDTSFGLVTRFTVSDFSYEGETVQSVLEYLSHKEIAMYTVENGLTEKDGETVTVNELIYPFGEDSTFTYSDTVKDTVVFGQNGYGYTVSFDVSADAADKLAAVTDTEKLKAAFPGMVLSSYETGEAEIDAKVVEGKLSYLQVSVPVRLAFILDGEKYEISYMISQDYFIQ